MNGVNTCSSPTHSVIITECEIPYYSTSALNSIRPRAYTDCDIKQSTGDTR